MYNGQKIETEFINENGEILDPLTLVDKKLDINCILKFHSIFINNDYTSLIIKVINAKLN